MPTERTGNGAATIGLSTFSGKPRRYAMRGAAATGKENLKSFFAVLALAGSDALREYESGLSPAGFANIRSSSESGHGIESRNVSDHPD